MGTMRFGVQIFNFNRFPIGAVHHEATKILIDLARDGNGIALLEAIGKPRLIEI